MTTSRSDLIYYCRAQIQVMINLLHMEIRNTRDPTDLHQLLNQLEFVMQTIDKILE